MSCALARTTIHGYFDGELDAAQASDFEHHLQSCTQCRALLHSMQSVRTRLQQSDFYEHVPVHLRSQFLSKLHLASGSAHIPARLLQRRNWLPALAVLSFLAGFSLALFLVSSDAESESLTAE